ncbi:hypothetical protein SAMN05192553_105240 [Cyclobacterium xiamenense]|uniref:DUF2237 domain-containing protein n=1 Tax=Cyclobacterium xiamenense TaxID=1297121 RepID=A0A1H6ZYC8_9BACT|nr:DUF2237 domain-containing protein [Cyclobacterium xiamenense]SEJ58483.1 hypothetical protein SAMN05192553_105240 [Cyclobacterium xiamenense]
MATNVFGQPLLPCCFNPLTGFYRDGYCRTGTDDTGTHTVCAIMTAEFLQFSLSVGNDLTTPRPEYGFPGLKPGDKWCLCLTRWLQAYHADVAPSVILEATHEKTLDLIPLDELIAFAAK